MHETSLSSRELRPRKVASLDRSGFEVVALATSSRPMAPVLTMGQLEDIQASCLADDIPIDFNRMSLWDEATARAYFEKGGCETAVPLPLHQRNGGGHPAADASGVAPSDAVAAGTRPPSRAFRWAVDISMWDPTPAQWTLLLELLTEEVWTLPPAPAHQPRTRCL